MKLAEVPDVVREIQLFYPSPYWKKAAFWFPYLSSSVELVHSIWVSKLSSLFQLFNSTIQSFKYPTFQLFSFFLPTFCLFSLILTVLFPLFFLSLILTVQSSSPAALGLSPLYCAFPLFISPSSPCSTYLSPLTVPRLSLPLTVFFPSFFL